MHPIARWLLFLANFLLVLYAIVQVAGRLLVPWLSSAEDQLNRLLVSRDIRVEGLEGRWSLLNPIVSARRVVLPAGELMDISLQPDLVESALRNTLVLRRAALGDGHLALARDDAGWWLEGMPRSGGSKIDLSGLLFESDELAGELTVILRGEADESIRISLQAINRGGRSELNASLTRPDMPSATANLRVDRTREIPLLRPPGHKGLLKVRDFALPRALLGQGEMTIRGVDGAWRVEDGSGRGALRLDGADLRLGGGHPFTLSSELSVWSAGWDWGVSGDLKAVAAGKQAVIRDIVASHTPGRIDARIDHVNADEVLGLARVVAAPIEKVDRWLTGLDASGQLRDVWAFVRLDDRTDARWRFGYGGRVLDGRTAAFNGVPAARGADAEVIGYDHGFSISLHGDALRIGFPDVFETTWDATDAAGEVQVFFRPGHSAVRGTGLRASTGSVTARGEFAVSNPELLARKGLVLLVEADDAVMADAVTFIPRTLEPKLFRWLQDAPREGRLSAIRFAYQGQNKAQGIEHARRVEIRTAVSGLALAYHPDWPVLGDVAGDLAVRGNDVAFAADSGSSEGISLEGSSVAVADRGGEVRITLASRGTADRYLAFVRGSPLLERMAFVRPEWALQGAMSLQGRIMVPLRSDAGEVRAATAELTGELSGVDAQLPDLRLALAGLQGPFAFATPYAVSSEGLKGTLWDEPVELTIEPGADHVWIRAEGDMTAARAMTIATLDDPGFVQGRFSYTADVGIAVRPEGTTELNLRSDLAGVDLDLPEGLARVAEDRTPSTLGLQFLDDYMVLSFQYRDVQGWLHVADAPLRGAVGLGIQPPMIDLADDFVRISGRLPEARLESWTRLFSTGETAGGSGTESPAARPVRIVVDDVHLDRAWVGDLLFDDVLLDVDAAKDSALFEFNSEKAAGKVRQSAVNPLVVEIDYLRFPAAPKPPDTPESPESLRKRLGPSPDEDPLSETLITRLPPMDLDIARVWRGDEDYGRWRMQLRKPRPDELAINNLDAEIKGLRITATEGVRWTAADDLTAFAGNIEIGNLAEVLPQWRYAPSVASEAASLSANVTWSGSPLNVGITGMAGRIGFSARNGRFLEVESGSGAMRLMSLFSFSAILKRLNFNFSDVIGRGVGFETLQTEIELANGILTFVQPMEVKSTSSDFRLGGTVNMHTGRLSNELVMTLPVSKNLPWYGVYIALANPLVGLGVIVGERVLRKPLEQFSSAKYEVRGTLTEPEVKFVELFDTQLTEPVGGAPPGDGMVEAGTSPEQPAQLVREGVQEGAQEEKTAGEAQPAETTEATGSTQESTDSTGKLKDSPADSADAVKSMPQQE